MSQRIYLKIPTSKVVGILEQNQTNTNALSLRYKA